MSNLLDNIKNVLFVVGLLAVAHSCVDELGRNEYPAPTEVNHER